MSAEQFPDAAHSIIPKVGAKLFSVIIPTRNEERLLENCLAQFTPDIRRTFGIEVIVSDGGSTDATLAIAGAQADRVVTHDDSSARQTIAEGRNRGITLATGDIFVFLNADTLVPNLSEFLGRIISVFSGDSKVSALAVKVQIMPDERKLSDVLFHGFFNQYVRLLNSVGIGMGRGECQIIRKNTFIQSGGYNPQLAAGEDFELYNRLCKFGKVKYDAMLLVYESPRRFRKYGYARVYFDWIKNGFTVLLKKRSASNVWEEVR